MAERGRRANIVSEAKNEAMRTFQKDDMIPCRSFTNGGLFIVGDRTGILYQWADYGDVIDMEYQDLIYLIRSKSPRVFNPNIVILDDDVVAQNKAVGELYESMYSTQDLKEIILDLSPDRMRREIENLPDGVKNTMKGIVSTMIHDGTLDSVRKIKALDDIFDTKLLLVLADA